MIVGITVVAAAGLCRATTPTSLPTSMPTSLPAPRPGGLPTNFTPNGGGDPTGLMWQMLSTGLVILALGGLALFAMKKILPKISRATGKRISVLETAYLGPRKAVHLIQVGARKLLVASSPEGVVMLDDMTGAFPADYAETARRVGEAMDASEAPDDRQVAE